MASDVEQFTSTFSGAYGQAVLKIFYFKWFWYGEKLLVPKICLSVCMLMISLEK